MRFGQYFPLHEGTDHSRSEPRCRGTAGSRAGRGRGPRESARRRNQRARPAPAQGCLPGTAGRPAGHSRRGAGGRGGGLWPGCEPLLRGRARDGRGGRRRSGRARRGSRAEGDARAENGRLAAGRRAAGGVHHGPRRDLLAGRAAPRGAPAGARRSRRSGHGGRAAGPRRGRARDRDGSARGATRTGGRARWRRDRPRRLRARAGPTT